MGGAAGHMMHPFQCPDVKTRNDLLKWDGFSDKQAKDLGYKNPLKMKTEFLQILKKMGFTFK